MSALDSSRDRSVRNMFDRIAGRYDCLNRVISFRLDRRWRRQVIRSALIQDDPQILDIGTGTGDLVFDAARVLRGRGRLVGLDFSMQMIRLGEAKRARAPFGESVTFALGSAMTVPFKSAAFDSAVTAFVLRNVSDLPLLFREALRVIKPGGRFVSLDMFPPAKSWFSPFYLLYFHRFMPRLGRLLSGDNDAYQYLSESVRRFHSPETVSAMMSAAGFENVRVQKHLSGAVCMHCADKPKNIAT